MIVAGGDSDVRSWLNAERYAVPFQLPLQGRSRRRPSPVPAATAAERQSLSTRQTRWSPFSPGVPVWSTRSTSRQPGVYARNV